MICPVLTEISYTQCIQWLEQSAIAEVRLDKLSLSDDEAASLFGHQGKTIATCRPGTMDESRRAVLLKQAVSNGAAFIDLELESFPHFGASIARYARQSGSQIIISYHNFTATPPRVELIRIQNQCRDLGAHIIKIACHVSKIEDNARLLGLYGEKDSQHRLIAIGMGSIGRLTRIMAPLLGSPFTYACTSPDKKTADGQYTVQEMKKIFEGLKNVT